MNPGDLAVAFSAGLLSPLGAACILPLYPGYLSFLAAHAGVVRTAGARLLLGCIAAAGIMAAMIGFGVVVGLILTLPLAGVLPSLSVIAYGVLGVIGLLLLSGRSPGLPTGIVGMPGEGRSFRGAFLFGIFFGVLILPCNAGPILILLALSTSAADLAASMGNFLLYGAGMAIPLIALSALSSCRGDRLAKVLVTHQRSVNILTGTLMVAVAAYYLLVVTRIQESLPPLL